MPIPTEPIGSIPRLPELMEAMQAFTEGRLPREAFDRTGDLAVRTTIEQLEATGSPIITDGEQTKPSFATYPVWGLRNVAPDGVTIPFADGHVRVLPRLTSGPFAYRIHADKYLRVAKRYAHVPVKQAIISASALSLLYPPAGIEGYSRETFLGDLLREHEADIRGCLQEGACKVQIDFTEGRLALKLDPTGNLLRSFVQLNNRVLDRFSKQERAKIGVHTCPGGDRDSTHSADVDYADLLPSLFELNVGCFYLQMASEKDPSRILRIIAERAKHDQRIFIGVTDPINPRVETAEEVKDRVLEAARHVPVDRLGTTDDCGFSPFGDDVSTSRETAFGKIRARVAGTAMAAGVLGI